MHLIINFKLDKIDEKFFKTMIKNFKNNSQVLLIHVVHIFLKNIDSILY